MQHLQHISEAPFLLFICDIFGMGDALSMFLVFLSTSQSLSLLPFPQLTISTIDMLHAAAELWLEFNALQSLAVLQLATSINISAVAFADSKKKKSQKKQLFSSQLHLHHVELLRHSRQLSVVRFDLCDRF